MLRRPQRTEAACGWRRGRRVPLRLPLVRGLGGELKQLPRTQPSGSRSRLECEHGAYRFFRSRSMAREHCSGTVRAAQQCTRRARDAGVAEQELSALAERVRALPAAAV